MKLSYGKLPHVVDLLGAGFFFLTPHSLTGDVQSHVQMQEDKQTKKGV